jgi:NAD(P)-dependent dehydrogenase (short-subunit alcohol dehydrogenase family)
MNFQDRDVVVTGGGGALGAAVIDALLRSGAWCHVPLRSAQAIEQSPSTPLLSSSFAA